MSSGKFHISKKGIPAPCHAKKGNCPLGGNETHFNTVEEAQSYVDEKNEKEYRLMPDVSDNKQKNVESKKLTPAQERAKEKAERTERLTSKLANYWKKKDGTPEMGMVNYCLNNTKYVEIGGSFVDVANSKPSIRKEIWYDDETERPQINEANFLNYNMQMEMPKLYKIKGRNVDGIGTLKMIPQYVGANDLSLATLTYEDNPSGEYREISESELEQINEGVKEVRVNYEKRLKTYYKRYGYKLIAKGYWKNR